ncbi:T9SS type A sorting domain-containing protein [Hymenobacter terrenus]|uniref:T9SS type A sorting domain-containing protein n=1 Tax=Hymenobacter terrenus TaxID=1629124 RepID=UPI000619CC9B|nr:T9SS type A sorting domain-containing protein [Hymenobacter terrenus]
MKKIVLSVLVAVAAVAARAPQAQAQTVCPAAPAPITVSGSITAPNTTWSRNNIYALSGFVYVRSGAVLTIEPGTIIKGIKSAATPAALIIEPGAQIIANGTASQPIVFTSNEPAGSRSRGDWGGLVLAGRAPINATGAPTIEGGIGTTYGGNLPNDNSGILRYVRIEFPGIPLSTAANSEINGLSLYGVGAGTTIEYVQVHSSGDDAFEWFGGNSNARYLIANATTDDDFDTDLGYTGRVQFAVTVRDAAVADVSGSTAFESDNDQGGSVATPQTAPVFSNVSAFLQGTTLNANYTRALHLRRNTAISIFNSVFTGWPTGLFIDGATSQASATGGSLVLRNNVLAGITQNYGANPASGFNHQSFFEDASRGNQVFSAISALGLNADNFNAINSNGTPNGVPEFALPAASVLASGASFADAKLTGAGNGGPNSTFQVVNYRGAFGPASTATSNWATGWTNFNPQISCYNRPGITLSNREVVNAPLQSLTVSPNPTSGNAATLGFDVKRTTTATVRVLDMMGRRVATVLEAGKLTAGPQSLALPTTLAPGVYVATVTTVDALQSVRFTVTE